MLKLLVALFGKDYVNRMIGTGTNVSKPIKFDKNSPFKLYSDSAFNDPDVLKFIDKKLAEYGPYALSNKNATEIANFEANAKRALEARKPKESQVKEAAEAMFGPLGKSDKPEAEIFDIGTKKKVDDEGIMTLKSELGLPEGVDPKSPKGRLMQELQKAEAGSPEAEKLATEGLDEFFGFGRGARGPDLATEGRRRAVVRQILLKDSRINIPEDVKKSLAGYEDLQRGADQNLDPLKVFETYYERDDEVLGALDGIIDTSKNEIEAADTFLSMKNNFKVKKPIVRESLDDEAVEMEETKDLGERLEDYDGDPEDLAEGGRPGKGIDYLMGL